MKIQEEIDRLGGVQPLEDKFYPLSKADIELVEKRAAVELPVDYKWLLSTYGEFVFRNSVIFKPIKNEPEYVHNIDLEIPNGTFFSSEVAVVYGKTNKDDEMTILAKLKTFRNRMPKGFLPIADDGMGNQICFCLSEENYQKVYWWDHEMEWDKEDYKDETGVSMPVAAKYQNVYLIANNVTEFFGKLEISANA